MRHFCVFKKSVFDFTLRYGHTGPHPDESGRYLMYHRTSGRIWTMSPFTGPWSDGTLTLVGLDLRFRQAVKDRLESGVLCPLHFYVRL